MEAIKRVIFYKIANIPNILTILNNIIKSIFIKRTYSHYKSLWKPYWIIINDNMLKFHDNDIRKQIQKELKIK